MSASASSIEQSQEDLLANVHCAVTWLIEGVVVNVHAQERCEFYVGLIDKHVREVALNEKVPAMASKEEQEDIQHCVPSFCISQFLVDIKLQMASMHAATIEMLSQIFILFGAIKEFFSGETRGRRTKYIQDNLIRFLHIHILNLKMLMSPKTAINMSLLDPTFQNNLAPLVVRCLMEFSLSASQTTITDIDKAHDVVRRSMIVYTKQSSLPMAKMNRALRINSQTAGVMASASQKWVSNASKCVCSIQKLLNIRVLSTKLSPEETNLIRETLRCVGEQFQHLCFDNEFTPFDSFEDLRNSTRIGPNHHQKTTKI